MPIMLALPNRQFKEYRAISRLTKTNFKTEQVCCQHSFRSSMRMRQFPMEQCRKKKAHNVPLSVVIKEFKYPVPSGMNKDYVQARGVILRKDECRHRLMNR